MFNPARLRKILGKFLLKRRGQARGRIKEYGTSGRRTLIDCQSMCYLTHAF